MKDSFRDFVIDQLSDLPVLECTRMFGSYGLYQDGIFFAIISSGKLYFKTNEESKKDYLKYKMKPFRPSKKQTLKNYYEVPDLILENSEKLTSWAIKAIVK